MIDDLFLIIQNKLHWFSYTFGVCLIKEEEFKAFTCAKVLTPSCRATWIQVNVLAFTVLLKYYQQSML